MMRRIQLTLLLALGLPLGASAGNFHFGVTDVQPSATMAPGKPASFSVPVWIDDPNFYVLGSLMADWVSAKCPSAVVDFGDGTQSTVTFSNSNLVRGPAFSGKANLLFSHVYSKPGSYPVSVSGLTPAATCDIGFVNDGAPVTVNVVNASQVGVISSTLQITSPSLGYSSGVGYNPVGGLAYIGMPSQPDNKHDYVNTGSNIADIVIDGPGGTPCSTLVDWGDGTLPQPVSGNLPLKAEHAYKRSGEWTINVKTAGAPSASGGRLLPGGVMNPGVASCTGNASGKFYAYPNPGKLKSVSQPGVVQAGQPFTVTITGEGICGLLVRQGDGKGNGVSSDYPVGPVIFLPANQFSWKANLLYRQPGTYTATFNSSECGKLTTQIKVDAPTLPKLSMPASQSSQPAATQATPFVTPPASQPSSPAGAASAPVGAKPASSAGKTPCHRPNKPGINEDKCD